MTDRATSLKQIVGHRLKSLRMERMDQDPRWTQTYVADRLKISLSLVSAYERGERLPPADNLDAFATLYNVSVDYILGRTDEPSPPASANITNAPSPILDRIKELAASANVAFENVLRVTEVTETDLAGLDPDEPDPHILWPIAQVLNTSMSYLAGLTDRVKPIIGPGQALHDSRNLYRPDPELDPEDAWDLEQAYLLARKRREERKKNRG